MEPRIDPDATDRLLADVATIRDAPGRSHFEIRQRLVRRLGALHDPDTGLTSFGFWAPDLTPARVRDHEVTLELFTPVDEIDFSASRQAVTMRRTHHQLVRDGDYWWGVLSGVAAGGRDRMGAFYWLRAPGQVVRDLVAHSIPYGSHAPAEVYDVASLQRRRRDLDHFATPPRAPTSILELHVPTATRRGSIAGLAEVYEHLGAALRAGTPLSPAEQVFAGYDAIQPLPVDPTIERPQEQPAFWVTDVVDATDGIVGVLLRHPDNVNWGYDNMVASSSATNPSLLETGRPDELVRLAEALHAMPEPVMLVYDIVYGHADNQALGVLPSRFVKGPNMYGQDLNHQDPTVRAILLEMQRRRVDTGADGLRVDGAQDFRFYDPRTGTVEYDDDYLQSMSDVHQQIGPHRRRMWMIFEDDRPWPAEGWETSSTYRDVIERQPDTFQWGPLIFAHNTPMLEGFWRDKWWRVEEIAAHGGNWISGCANHDTVRRGTQVDPTRPINRHLGDTLPEILANAYDNPAVAALSYALLPGIPMDFLQATTRTPWAFMRTTDDRYGVKVMCEEAGFLDWELQPEDFDRPEVFRRVRRHGFDDLATLRAFLADLSALIEPTDYDVERMALEVDAPDRFPAGGAGLHAFAHDFMVDVHDLCNVDDHLADLDPARTGFSRRLRDLRRRFPWLRDDFRASDRIDRVDGDQTLYVGARHGPGGGVVVTTVANMAGPAWTGPAGSHGGEGPPTLLAAGARFDGDDLLLPDGTAAVWVA